MRNFLKDFLLGVVCIAFILLLLIIGGYGDTHYSTIAQVYEVSDTDTTFIDGAGYLWGVNDTDYIKGQTVKISFFNNCTDYTRNDDVILKVRKIND